MYQCPQPSAALRYMSLLAKHMHRLLPCKSGRVSGACKHLVGRLGQPAAEGESATKMGPKAGAGFLRGQNSVVATGAEQAGGGEPCVSGEVQLGVYTSQEVTCQCSCRLY